MFKTLMTILTLTAAFAFVGCQCPFKGNAKACCANATDGKVCEKPCCQDAAKKGEACKECAAAK